MAGRLRGWQGLSWPERGALLLMMLVGLPLIAAAVRMSGYVATRAWLERHSPRAAVRAPTPGDLHAAQRLAELASIAGRHGPITATCLRQSLLIYWLLRRRGFSPDFRIGVRKQAAILDAHAWIELEGRALGQASILHSPFA